MSSLAWIVVVLLAILACERQGAAPSISEASHHEVLLHIVEETAFPEIFWAPGKVVAAREISIASRVSGHIRNIQVDEGDRVSKGELLAEIEDVAIDAAITQTQATIVAAKADLDDAHADVSRFRKLAKTHALSEEQLRDAKVRVAMAQAVLDRAKADLESKLAEREYVRLLAPEDSIVVERRQNPGDLAGFGIPILKLESLALELEIFLPVSWLSVIEPNVGLTVKLDGMDELKSTISGVVPSADPISRQIKIRLALSDEQPLIPGIYGQARLIRDHHSAPAVPLVALIERAGVQGVFVADHETHARFRSLRLGRKSAQQREVLAGLSVGDRVVLEPSPRLRDGDRLSTQ